MSPAPNLTLPGDGEPNGYPRARSIHWTPARKAEVLSRIRQGLITRGEAMSRWAISVEELDAWLSAERRAGHAGLRVTVKTPDQGRLL